MEERILQQQRIETELIAARLFRFRARRSLGVLYSLCSILPLLGIILFATVSLPFAVAGSVAGIFMVWFAARSSGLAHLSRMQYGLDFIKGEKGAVYDAKREIWLSRRTNFAWFMASAWPWAGYIVASSEGAPLIAAVFMAVFVAEFVTITSFAQFTKASSVFEWRLEDWAFVLGDVAIAFAVLIPGVPSWLWVVATPLFVLCGTKSLYDAPKELALVEP